MKRKLLSLLLAACMLLAMLPATALAADTVSSGSCGENLTWTLDDEGTLTISGTGEMTDAPWYDERSDITTVVIQDGVTSIGDSVFRDCTSLISVTIPDGVTSIGDLAFYNCTGLISVTIPDSVTSIGSYAFYNCASLTSVTIPDGVTSIGSSAFYGCSSLTSVTIPDGVTSIGAEAFYNCTSLTSVTIPDGVTSIGDFAFSGCTGLTGVTTPDSVTVIGVGAFQNTPWLKSLGEFAVVNGILLAYQGEGGNVVIPDGVTSIGSYAFSGCTGLTSVTIPDGVTSIGDYAFSRCTGLISATIPDGVTSIGDSAFYNCDSLTGVTIPDSVTSIGSGAFKYTPWLESLGEFAVVNGILLAYQGEGGDVVIPDGVTSIGNFAFYPCTGLTSVTIPDGVTSIGDNVFYSCISLTAVTIPGSVTSIGNAAFKYTPWLESLGEFAVANGILLAYQGEGGDVVIPDGVTSIGSNAFSFCTSLTSVTIPDGVTSIGDCAFYSCTSLTAVTIPGSVTNIGSYAFSNRISLTDVYYGGSQEAWNAIEIGKFNDPLLNTAIHYTEPTTYEVLDGDNSRWNPEEAGDLSFHIDSELEDFVSVSVDGDLVDPSDYDVTAGSTIVTLHADYLAALEAGEHILTVSFTDGAAQATFTVMDETATGPVTFTDVADGAFYAAAVNWAVERKITSGTGNNRFSPLSTCTRAEIVTFLYRAAGSPEVDVSLATQFSDVAADIFYAKAVAWAVENNITSGTGNGQFSPLRTCTRAEIVTFLWRYAGKPAATASASFTDVKDSDFYAAAVAWAVEKKITAGTGNNRFSPLSTCTRAEAVTFLYRDRT